MYSLYFSCKISEVSRKESILRKDGRMWSDTDDWYVLVKCKLCILKASFISAWWTVLQTMMYLAALVTRLLVFLLGESPSNESHVTSFLFMRFKTWRMICKDNMILPHNGPLACSAPVHRLHKKWQKSDLPFNLLFSSHWAESEIYCEHVRMAEKRKGWGTKHLHFN